MLDFVVSISPFRGHATADIPERVLFIVNCYYYLFHLLPTLLKKNVRFVAFNQLIN